jgi:hypothetical protein
MPWLEDYVAFGRRFCVLIRLFVDGWGFVIGIPATGNDGTYARRAIAI